MSAPSSRKAGELVQPARDHRRVHPPRRVGGAPVLDTALGRRGVVEAIASGLARPRVKLDLHDIQPLPKAFRMMVEERTFHFAEMPLNTLAMAIEHGRPLIGLPIVLNRDFHYRSIVVGAKSTIRDPRDLIGRRVGVRAYSQTTGVWARGLLSDEFGVAHSDIRWVTTEGAHVSDYVDPDFVERAPAGSTLPALLASGDIDAAVIMDPKLESKVARPLFPDAFERAATAYGQTGIFPVNHVVALDTDIAEQFPWLADELYALFSDSKNAYRARLSAEGPRDDADRYALDLQNYVVKGDFNPYGLDANRASIEQLVRYARTQGLITRELDVERLFLPVNDIHSSLAPTKDRS
ncbi:hypothetical protein [Rhodococcoides kyotonense]|uniref:4,5-dihydroxyphthalate decarboxylase n=1 Tax=Rhodococcoides kyotonense TaxID=398843 RepID=A0A239N3D5_9NOCA|nr:hypothetical protein [Rhodococcus kyotonensis]SNT48689.1 4,5-dihydroxyphthalate decarboxylase [Rhodococcus kyotonensis]